jgi:hypothetical protein
MDAPRVNVESETGVRVDALRQIGDADHHVIDAGQHRQPTTRP